VTSWNDVVADIVAVPPVPSRSPTMTIHPKISSHTYAHPEKHRHDRTAWLRAAVLGANDGIVSTASLLIGVAASNASRNSLLVTGAAALSAGALAMAAGEFVSVSSQSDLESADIAREKRELLDDPEHEEAELAAIYRTRGLSKDLAKQVAAEMHAHDALGAHVRDELGFADGTHARPVQAAMVSAAGFTSGGLVPVLVAVLSGTSIRLGAIALTALLLLALSGALAGRAGGSSSRKAAMRVLVGGGLAMAVTAIIGRIVGAAV
jgi:vacuolar iron transporter family protein